MTRYRSLKRFIIGNKGNKTFYYSQIAPIDFIKSIIQKFTITIQIESVKYDFILKQIKNAQKMVTKI